MKGLAYETVLWNPKISYSLTE